MILKKRLHSLQRDSWLSVSKSHLLARLSLAEDEEDSELFLFQLYLKNREELKFFKEWQRKRICQLLGVLIRDTKQHAQMLQEVIQELKQKEVCHAA